MSDVDPRTFEKGEWVQVWGQIVDGNTHPSDELVEFFSHNEQWHGHVDRARIDRGEGPPSFAARCFSLYEHKPERFMRCEKHFGHSGAHQQDEQYWYDDAEYGSVEPQ